MATPQYVLIEYNMVGQLNSPPYEPVYWTVYNTPDMSGAQSGYAGQLINIAVASTYNINSPTQTVVVPTSAASGDLGGNYPAPRVIGINTIPINPASTPVNGEVLTFNAVDGYIEWSESGGGGGGPAPATDGYAPISKGGVWVPQGVMGPVFNVKTFGAKGDGIHDDTAAIQNAINQFSHIGSALVSGTIYFPAGVYNISQTLTYTGTTGTGIRMVGEMATDGSLSESGTVISWVGAADGYMMETFGMNQSEFQYLHFDGNNTAFTCFWVHTLNNTGGPPSNGNVFHHCYFANCVGLGAVPGYEGTQGLFTIGDINSNYEVATLMFRDCLFLSSGFGPTGTFACVNQLGGFNTEQFMFENCGFGNVGASYGYFAAYHPNNVITMRDCQFGGGFSEACIFLGGGAATLFCTNTICENGNLPSPYTGKGLFLNMVQYNQAYINGGEITMDCTNNNFQACIGSSGKLVMENVKVDCSGEIGPQILGAIATDGATYSDRDSVIVRNCIWVGATEQIPIIDGNGNWLTITNKATSIGTEEAFQIILENNLGQTGGLNYVLPSVDAGVVQHSGNGLWWQGSFPTGMSIYGDRVNASLSTTSALQITSAALAGIGTTSFTFVGPLNIINHTKIQAVIVDVSTAFSGPGISNLTVEVGDSFNGNNGYILPASVTSVTHVKPIGASAGDLGSLLAGAVQGGYYYWDPDDPDVSQPMTITFTATGANLSAVSGGSLTVYITVERLG